jgi:hypothetical protein
MNDEGKWGFIDTTGKVVIPFQFEMGSMFSEGLALFLLIIFTGLLINLEQWLSSRNLPTRANFQRVSRCQNWRCFS